jgi:tetratricopeptide (TPR) repeat protein
MPRPRTVRLVSFIFMIAGCVSFPLPATMAQQASSAVAKTVTKTDDKPEDYSQEAFVVEQFKTLYRYEKDGTGQREMILRVKVQSDAGVQRFGQLIFPYSSANEKLELDSVRVKKADGTVVTAPSTSVQDLSAPIAREAPVYTDLRQKHVTVPGLRPGDVLEYHVIWKIETPLAANNFWLEHNFILRDLIVLDDELEVNVPLDGNVKLKTEKGFEPAIKDLDQRRIYTWKHANLKRETKEEREAREKKEAQDDEDPKPQIQMTTFQSWDDVGRWYADLQKDRIVPDEKIRAKTAELTRGLTTEKEKIRALYQFVAQDFRYVSLSLGQGRYQPHAAADVLSNQYGDCKDKHTLLAAMLNAAGIPAYPALMNSSRKVDANVPSPGQFDHVITAVPLSNGTIWLDTTAEIAPFGLIAPTLRDKQALLIPASGPARLETTPAEPPFLSTEAVEIDGKVDELGKLTAHSRVKVRGDGEMFLRMMFRRTPKSDWKQLGYYLSSISGVRGEVTELKPGDITATEQPFELEYDVSSNDFLDWSSKKLKVSIPLPTVSLTNADPDKQESSKPLQLGPPIETVYRLKLVLPAKYKVRVPLALKVTRDYAEYSATYKLDANTLIAERTFRLRQHEIPAARTQDYLAFVAATRADEAQTVLLETDVAGSPAIPETVKVEELMQAAEAASKNGNYPVVEQLLKRVIEKEPKHKAARRQLAWALTAQQKYDAAIDVLVEQTKTNPFDDYSYNLLGQVYWRQQKYSEAEAAFRKQLEISPLDKTGHSNLGRLLVEWRKYKDAVPELESAISVNPEDEGLYLALGRAYLNLGDTQKGTENFDKAVKLAPGPAVWNDAAYFMAVSNVGLERAQQYAESAVTDVATELRNVELENLTLENLRDMDTLSAYWDTLGWVHFQKGNLDLAERYVRAAWFISQHSEVGYHLGQIEEKRGRKEAALQAYSMASVAFRLVPEATESLERLVAANERQAVKQKAARDLNAMRTIKLGPAGKDLKDVSEAQFYVVLVPGAARNGQVAEVKFISGDEKLRPLATALKSANFNFVFPDDAATKVIRRGTLSCKSVGSECTFILMTPDSIMSLD